MVTEIPGPSLGQTILQNLNLEKNLLGSKKCQKSHFFPSEPDNFSKLDFGINGLIPLLEFLIVLYVLKPNSKMLLFILISMI